MQKITFLILHLMLLVSQIVAKQSFKVSDYVPEQIGYKWHYKNNVKDGMSPIIVSNAEKTMFGSLKTTK